MRDILTRVIIIQVPVQVFGVVWASIDPEHKKLSAMKLRQWTSELLSRSILLGSTQEGLSMQYVNQSCF